MLLNLHKKSWMDGLMLRDYNEHCKLNETTVKEMLDLAKSYNKVGQQLNTPPSQNSLAKAFYASLNKCWQVILTSFYIAHFTMHFTLAPGHSANDNPVI